MDKKLIIEFFGGAEKAAKRLGYAHKNCIYNWPNPVPKRTMQSIKIRMKAKGIKIPKAWSEQ